MSTSPKIVYSNGQAFFNGVPLSDLLTAAAVAPMLGIGYRQVINLAHRHRIARIGNQFAFTIGDVERLKRRTNVKPRANSYPHFVHNPVE